MHILQVTDLYRQKIPDGAVVLDLMSSWVSHFPEEAQYGRVIGHGMNAKEVTSSQSRDNFAQYMYRDQLIRSVNREITAGIQNIALP